MKFGFVLVWLGNSFCSVVSFVLVCCCVGFLILLLFGLVLYWLVFVCLLYRIW